jgi:hypothetical protein
MRDEGFCACICIFLYFYISIDCSCLQWFDLILLLSVGMMDT